MPRASGPRTSVAKSGSTPLIGAISLVAGTNITLTQAAQNITIDSSAGSGGTNFPTVTKTADYTVTTADYDLYLNPTDGTTITMTLFTAVGNSGHHLTFKLRSNAVVKIVPNGAETIEFDTLFQLNSKGEGVTLSSDGSNWYVI